MNELIKTILFILCCYSMSSIIVEQNVFAEIRDKLKTCAVENPDWLTKKVCALISCMYCTGTWSGMFLTLTGFNIFNYSWFDFFYGGLLGGLSSYMLYLIVGEYEKKINKNGSANVLE